MLTHFSPPDVDERGDIEITRKLGSGIRDTRLTLRKRMNHDMCAM